MRLCDDVTYIIYTYRARLGRRSCSQPARSSLRQISETLPALYSYTQTIYGRALLGMSALKVSNLPAYLRLFVHVDAAEIHKFATLSAQRSAIACCPDHVRGMYG